MFGGTQIVVRAFIIFSCECTQSLLTSNIHKKYILLNFLVIGITTAVSYSREGTTNSTEALHPHTLKTVYKRAMTVTTHFKRAALCSSNPFISCDCPLPRNFTLGNIDKHMKFYYIQ